VDKDGDGKLSRDEFLAVFDRLDADKDGFVTKEETAAMAGRIRELSAKRFQAMDKDGDGKVSLEELAAYLSSPAAPQLPEP
jgi:Ca2+-binding EF-hand superfamily protein